jgi:hypothetical protein
MRQQKSKSNSILPFGYRLTKLLSILPAILSAIICLIISVFVVLWALGLFRNGTTNLNYTSFMLGTIGIGWIPLIKFSTDIKYLRRNYNKLVLAQVVILGFSLLLLAIGITRVFYHLNPANNFRAYVKEREQVVSLIQTKQLKVDKSTQTSRVNEGEKVNLPEKYQGLSRNGQVSAIGEGNSLEVIFIHSTMGFGDGVRYIIYRADGDKNKISVIPYTQGRRPPFVGVEQLKNQWFSVIVEW